MKPKPKKTNTTAKRKPVSKTKPAKATPQKKKKQVKLYKKKCNCGRILKLTVPITSNSRTSVWLLLLILILGIILGLLLGPGYFNVIPAKEATLPAQLHPIFEASLLDWYYRWTAPYPQTASVVNNSVDYAGSGGNVTGVTGTWISSDQSRKLALYAGGQGSLSIETNRNGGLYTDFFEFSWSASGSSLQLNYTSVTVIRNPGDIVKIKELTKSENGTLSGNSLCLNGIEYRKN